jgi:hypothetical protein
MFDHAPELHAALGELTGEPVSADVVPTQVSWRCCRCGMGGVTRVPPQRCGWRGTFGSGRPAWTSSPRDRAGASRRAGDTSDTPEVTRVSLDTAHPMVLDAGECGFTDTARWVR